MKFNPKHLLVTSLLVILAGITVSAQYWQQEVDYTMKIDVDAEANQYTGDQVLVYKNNSPDTLTRVYYHLYFNAFQPGSMMDERSLSIQDPDSRVATRISKLSPEEVGYHQIMSLTQDGAALQYKVEGTILEVSLQEPIVPGASTTFHMEYQAQVPLQVRRSGRDNREGIRFSMSQWYPKLSEYDAQGWHPNPYVGREFHGVWGDFDVTITIDEEYTVGATGRRLETPGVKANQAPDDMDKRARRAFKKRMKDKKAWRFIAKDVHDFVWAADQDYEHTRQMTPSGVELHFYFQPGEKTSENWANLPRVMSAALEYISEKYGEYPFDKYSFIQGGDGGMEYPMATLITGERGFNSLVGVSVHELMHSWYQMLLGTNEALYPWMDEGFTSFASNDVMNYLIKEELINGTYREDPQQGSMTGYINFTASGMEEPLSTHADHYTTNGAYGVGSYVKGAVFAAQLRYIMGEQTFWTAFKDYFDKWSFKHPTDKDFIKIMEKHADMELDWYREYMVNTTHTIDYGVKGIKTGDDGHIIVTLEKIGKMPMPLDVYVTTRDGGQKIYHLPLRMMRGEKSEFPGEIPAEVMPDWTWTRENYELHLSVGMKELLMIEIDPLQQMADVNKDNNRYEQAE